MFYWPFCEDSGTILDAIAFDQLVHPPTCGDGFLSQVGGLTKVNSLKEKLKSMNNQTPLEGTDIFLPIFSSERFHF